MSKYAIILDGGFVIRKHQDQLKRFPTVEDFEDVRKKIGNHPYLKESELYRVFMHHAEPCSEVITNPLDNSVKDLSKTEQFKNNTTLLHSLNLTPFYAVRLGTLSFTGWKIGQKAMKRITKPSSKSKDVKARDLVPDIAQKGVDIKIALDMSFLATNKLVDKIVLVSGDSDMVPVLKMVRTSGVQVFLDSFGHGLKLELKYHVDDILS